MPLRHRCPDQIPVCLPGDKQQHKDGYEREYSAAADDRHHLRS
jgi:hypothetical protein